MGLIQAVISALVAGVIIGPLGRLALPGPNPMSIGMTIAVGAAGALVGGLVGIAIGAGVALTLILQVLAAAAIIAFMQKRGIGRR